VNRQFSLSLVSSDRSWSVLLFSGATGESGQRRVEFDVPGDRTGNHFFSAQVTDLDQPLDAATTIVKGAAILIETDKPIYKPGQKIQGRVVLLDNALKPTAGDVEVIIQDAKGLRIARLPLSCDQYGAAPFALDLANEVNFGTWKIRARSGAGESTRDVRVEQYTLPRFDLGLKFRKTWALVDEVVNGSVEARYFFGKPVEGKVDLAAKRWIGAWTEYARIEGVLSDGRIDFNLPAVAFVAGTPAQGGQGSVTVEVSVTDSTGHKQSVTEVLTITQAAVVITLVPASNTLKAGITAAVLVTTKAPDGVPASVPVSTATDFYSESGALLTQFKQELATVDGSAVLSLLPPEKTSFAVVRATTTIEKHTTTTEVELGGAYSPSGEFLSLARMDGEGSAAVGRVLLFSAAATRKGTIYYEVYAGGRTVLSDASEDASFSFPVTPDMIPRAKVVAYKINDNNEVAADSLTFDVNLPMTISVAAGFDPSQVKPGEPVRVNVDTGLGRRALLGLSIVDESVLALGRSRLHMAEVFAELERRFLEPEAEVHEGDPVPGILPERRTRGALDILHEAGLEVAVSQGLTVPAGQTLRGWKDVVVVGPPNMAGGGAGQATEAPRLRQFFPETWVWEPTFLTDEAGRAELNLSAPDSITGWKLSVVGTCPTAPAGAPGLVLGEAELTVFQDFFIEPSLPYSVVRGEIFPVKVDVFNYLDRPQTVQLTLGGSSGFELLGQGKTSLEVPANSALGVHFQIRPTAVGEFPVHLTAIGSTLSDAVLRHIKVVAEGIPVEQVLNGVIQGGETLPLDIVAPSMAVKDSHRAGLYLSASPVAQSMEGVSDLLGMPYGCGEQNMIFLAPDVEILRYLREIGELAPEVRAKAEYYVNVGYQRELTFQCDDGGFAAFGGKEGSLWLTAFVLSTFSGAREVRDIDESVLTKAAAMLVSRQQRDGSFRTDDFLIHKEMDGGMENLFALAAYTANALADYGGTETAAALAKAAGYLQSNYPTVYKDPYSLAIAAVALLKVPGFENTAETLVDRLLELAVDEGPGIHWETYPVETTGYAAIALLNSRGGVGRAQAQEAVEWLSTQRNALGGYGRSTQDTVVALRALFLAARKVHRGLNVDLSVLRESLTIFSVHIDEDNFDLVHQFELPLGESKLVLQSTGQGSVGYQLVNRFNVPGELLPPPKDMVLEVVYKTDHVEVDEIVDVGVSLKYTGTKTKTGMVIVDIGIPTGFDAVASSLDALTASGTVDRVETAGRKVIFYLDGLVGGEPRAFSFKIRALYPVRAEGPVSKAYEYYDPSIQASHRQEQVSVGDPAPRSREGFETERRRPRRSN
jgi:CD109 antigen